MLQKRLSVAQALSPTQVPAQTMLSVPEEPVKSSGSLVMDQQAAAM